MKVAIICQTLKYYAGTERVVYELYNEFQKRGIEIHLGTAEIGKFYSYELYPARINDIPNCMDDSYDLIVNFHTATFGYLFEKGVNARRVIHFSLSPYEPIEFPIFQEGLLDRILANSEETKESLISAGIANEFISVFPNSHSFDEKTTTDKKDNLKRVIVVSNHIPIELREAIDLASEIEFHLAGINDNVKFIDAPLLGDYDAVITIGYTVVTSVLSRTPVYLYDHFGGGGWLRPENFQRESYYNFSGRPDNTKKEPHAILEELKSGYAIALKNRSTLYELMKSERNISRNVDNLLLDFGGDSTFRKPNSYLVNFSKSYFKLFKMNQHLQDIVSDGDFSTSDSCRATEELQEKFDVLLKEQKKIMSSITEVKTEMSRGVTKRVFSYFSRLIRKN